MHLEWKLSIFPTVGFRSPVKVALSPWMNSKYHVLITDDWKFLFPSVPIKLRKLHAEGYKLVIFTNQGGILRGTVKAKDIQQKIEAIISKTNVPMQAMIAGGKKGKCVFLLIRFWLVNGHCNFTPYLTTTGHYFSISVLSILNWYNIYFTFLLHAQW